uniref:Reverse transcriptase domain-containing protein n=1 Tax=Aegilops tauschii subsp. strangulata TaxID=200361 RepID=A0A453HNM1_AEGTS
LEILKLFGDSTGLCINQQKSSAIPIRCDDVALDHVLLNFGGGRASFPFRYLGLPVTTARTRLVHLQFILDRIRARLAGWKGKLIPLAGRRVL